MNSSLVKFLKTFFYSSLAVFFVNYFIPGIHLVDPSKLPHIRGDVFFPLGLGFLNSLIFPALKVLDSTFSPLRLAVVIFVLNFAAYAFLKLLSIGIQIETVEGYLLGALLVSVLALLISGWEMRKNQPKPGPKIEGVKFPE